MVVSYDEPHHPFTCPVEYLEKYADFYYELGEKAQDDLANKPEHHRLWAQAMPSPVEMTGFITIRSILPVMTLLMTKSDGSSMP